MEGTIGEDQTLETKVADLINPDRTWNEQKVRSIANPTDATCILQVPIPAEGRPNMLIWPFTEDGAATVRSVYH